MVRKSRLPKQIFHLRLLGLGLSFFAIGTVFWEQKAGAGKWLYLFAFTYVWPFLAYRLSSTSPAPRAAEKRNFLVDAFVMSTFFPLVHWNLIVCSTLAAMQFMGYFGLGGKRFFIKCLVFQIAGALVLLPFTGWQPDYHPSILNILGCLPLLALYPAANGIVTNDFALRLASQRNKLAEANEELQSALEEIKVLRGIIPICSRCKKIRDDQGAWNMIEVYISKHSEAEFSHGYCPDCLETVYSEAGINPPKKEA